MPCFGYGDPIEARAHYELRLRYEKIIAKQMIEQGWAPLSWKFEGVCRKRALSAIRNGRHP